MRLTFGLILICGMAFLMEILFPPLLDIMVEDAVFSYDNILQGKWWVFITSIFIHADFEHFVYNMVGLFIFGYALEGEISPKEFLLAFFLAGIMGNLAFMAFYPTEPGIGASGAIFGLMGAAMILSPFKLVFAFPYAVPIPILLFGIMYAIPEFLGIVYPSGDIAHAAHIGGLLSGFSFAFYKRKRGMMPFIFCLILILAFVLYPLLSDGLWASIF